MATTANAPVIAPPAPEAAGEQTTQRTYPQLLEDAVAKTLERNMQELRLEEGRFEFQQRRAKLFAASGLFGPPADSQMAIAQAMVKIELGGSMGFTPAESLQGINIIKGVTSIAAALRASRMQACGYDWAVDWLGTHDAPEGCRLWLYQNGKPIMRIKRDAAGKVQTAKDGTPLEEQVFEEFTKADAQKQELLGKDNWKKAPRNMYFARAITNLQRFYAPKVLNINLPSTEEIADQEPPAVSRRESEHASINLDQITPSAAENRGHDDTASGNITLPAQDDPAPVADLKHLGAKDGVPIYNRLPDPATVTHGQLVWVRTESGEDLYEFSESFGSQFIQCEPARIEKKGAKR